MSSVSGRVGSAQLLRSVRERKSSLKSETLSIKNETENQQGKSITSLKDKIIKEEQEEEEEEEELFRLLTEEKILEKRENIKQRNLKIKELKDKPQSVPVEGKLVDGEIVYEDKEDLKDDIDDYGEIDPSLADGNQVPERLGKLKKELIQKPLEEIDPYINLREETFIVIGKRITKYYIYRFSSTNSFFIFSPFHPVRKALIFLSTWQFFDWFMILTILANCIILAIDFTKTESDITEYVFTIIYTIEFIFKVLAKGFILKPYTYLRDPWNWLDFILILLSYITIIISKVDTNTDINLSSLRAFRVFRAFKTVNIIPGLKTIVSAIIKSFLMFLEVLVLMVIALIVFALFSLQAYQGAFSQKCVKKYNATNSNISYSEWIQIEDNWLYDKSIGEYAMCCNGTVTNEGRVCDNGYVCLTGIGQNPNYGLTHYDNFGFSMMLNFQVMSLDHWEDIYNRVIDTMGPWNIFYFLPIVFIGSFYLINLMLAVVSLAYTIESENEKKKAEFVPQKKKDLVYDIDTLKQKIAEKERKIEERKKKIKNEQFKIENEETTSKKNTSNKMGFKDSLGDSVNINDNEIAVLSSIKLSNDLGKYNTLIQQGNTSCHIHGEDLVTDKRNCYCCIKTGKHYINWIKIQNFFLKIVTSLYFELFISFCIILNTIIMAIQYYDQPDIIDDLQNYSNYIISSIFILESIFKIIAYGRQYFFDASNWFDLIIIIMSIIDFSVPNINGLSVFRTFRLMRIFKLAKTWKTMRKILIIIGHSVAALSYLSIILFIVIYVFALIGLNLFSTDYTTYYSDSEMPRSNFNDILRALLLIFRILCGECIEPMLECWRAAGPSCVALFYPTVLFGNFLILNLFMAMLLDAFDSTSIKSDEDDNDELSKQLNKIKDKIAQVYNSVKLWFKKKFGVVVSPLEEKNDIKSVYNELDDFDKTSSKKFDATSNWSESTNEEQAKKLQDCFPEFLYAKVCKCATKETKLNLCFSKFREFILRIIENKIFESFIIICILVSSLLLAFDDVYNKKDSTQDKVLTALDYTFQAIFFIEMIFKWIGYGLKRYFTDWWCILDFIIVMLSIVNLGFVLSNDNTNISFLKVLRALRAFRPLRAISRWEGMKIVINALGKSIPAIIDVLIVCLVFWLIFSIMGVTLFKGKFFKCVHNFTGVIVDNVTNKTECLNMNSTMWFNKRVNFDNVANGYLSLLQLATFEGWRELIDAGVDSVDVNMQPKRDSNMAAHLFFVAFIIFGSFFTLNLFVGVIIDNFNNLKKKYDSGIMEMFLTPSQKTYIQTVKRMSKKKPQKTVDRPQSTVQGFIYDIVTSTKFQISMVIVVIIHLISMGFEYYKQPDNYSVIFNIINTTFATIFGLEIIFKLIGLRQHFFRNLWNVFDLILTIVCLIALPFDYYVQKFMVNPFTFYVIRLFRLIRALRFVKAAKGIRKLIFALLISLPALFNVAILLFLIIYIYSIIAMNFFMNLQLQGTLTPTVNFQTFGKAFLLLFRVGTISGWNDILEALMLQSTDPGSTTCQDDYDLQSLSSTVDPKTANGCGSPGTAVFFMVTYVVIVRMIMINMYIAVILENYDQAHEQEEIGITEDDFENFYTIWEKYDPHATQFIKLEQISDLVDELGPPLGVSKPNEMAITSFNLPIIKGDLIHCLDILHGLTTYALGGIESNKEFIKQQKKIDELFSSHFPLREHNIIITTTMERKKLEIAARTLQRAWRKFKLQRNFLLTQSILREKRQSQILDASTLTNIAYHHLNND